MKRRGICAAVAAALVISAAGAPAYAEGNLEEYISELTETEMELPEEDTRTEVVITDAQTGMSTGEPFINGNGVTMAPLRMIGDLVGAEYSYDAETQTVTVSKGEDVSVQFVVGSAYADVNGYTEEIEPPVISGNGYTMVPLRFVCETLGAEVVYTDDGKIFVDADPDGGYDDMLSQKIDSEWVGDSKYGWSMKNPQDMTTSNIYSSSDYVSFYGTSGSLTINITERDEEKVFGTLYTREKYVASRTSFLREAELFKGSDGYDRFYLLTDSDNEKYYTLCTMNDKYMYEITAKTQEDSIENMRAVADSFKIGMSDGDVYDFAQNRLVNYKSITGADGAYKMQVPEPWMDINSYYGGITGDYNFAAVSDVEDDYSGILISIYSKAEDASARTLLEDVRNKLVSAKNADFEGIGEITEYDKGLYFELKTDEYSEYFAAFEQGDYVYCVDLEIYRGDEENPIEYADDVKDVILGSIECKELTEEDAGKIIFMQEPRGVYDTDKGNLISIKYPIWWSMSSRNGYLWFFMDGDSYELNYDSIMLSINANEADAETEKEFKELEEIDDIKLEKVRVGETEYKYFYREEEEESYIGEYYVAVKDGVVCTITLMYDKDAKDSEALATARGIMESIKILNKEDK